MSESPLVLTEEQEYVFNAAQTFADSGNYDMAMAILESRDCVLGSWQKGKICLQAAEELFNSWFFRHYATQEMKDQYVDLLNTCYSYLDRTSILLTQADSTIQGHLNKNLWHLISQVEYALIRVKPIPDSYDEYQLQDECPTTPDYLAETLVDWKL